MKFLYLFEDFGLKIEQENLNRFVGKKDNLPYALTAFQFQPYLVNSLPECYKLSYVNNQTEKQNDYPKISRQVILTQASVKYYKKIRFL